MKKQTKNLLPRTLAYCSIAAFAILIVKDIVDNHRLKRDLELDPHYQSMSHAADAMNLIRGHSFAELSRNEQHKIVMKCAEAYALGSLPNAQQYDEWEPAFRRYLLGLSVVARTDYSSASAQQADQATEMIRDYLYTQYGHSEYECDDSR